MNNRAVFFDRDGTLNYDPGYISDPDKLKLYEGAADAVRILKDAGFKIIVITNQSGIARGYFTHADLKAVHQRMNELLREQNTSIDAFYYCPFHPDFNSEDECRCRKPSPDMILKAAEEHNIDLHASYMVGDSASDIECGKNAGVRTVFVKTNNKKEATAKIGEGILVPDFSADNISMACEIILNDFRNNN